MIPFAALLFTLLAPAPNSPFDPPPAGIGGDVGARARFAESLSLLAGRLDRDPADADALAELLALNEQLGRAQWIVPVARKALEEKKLDEAARTRIGGILGIALVSEVNSAGGFGNVIVFRNGRIVQRGRQLSDDQRKLLTEAEERLRAAVKRDSESAALREALADAIESLHGDPEKGSKEADELRTQADVIRQRNAPTEMGEDPFAKKAAELLDEAMLLELADEHPDHVRALEKRKQALVLAFCADTIPFEFAATLYEPVSLLAPRAMVEFHLTRMYQNKAKEIDQVPPRYHGAPLADRLGKIAALGRDRSRAADAVLLALVRGAEAKQSPLARAAMDALADGDHEAARSGLPLLLAKALFAQDASRFPVAGQCLLVELAVRLDCKAAADVLLASEPRDRDLYWPRRVAWALGALGNAEHAPKLLAVARDGSVDIAFRRAAARACARLDAESARALDSQSELAIALAAGRYESTKDEATKGRILNGFANDLEIDEAARYSAELSIVEAIPSMEAFLAEFGEKKDHPARLVVERALAELTRAR